MKDIAAEFTEMLDKIIPPGDAPADLQAFDRLTDNLAAYRHTLLPDSSEGQAVSKLASATISIVGLRYGDLSSIVPTLAEWMQAVELVNTILHEINGVPLQMQLKECLYQLGGVIGGVDHQEDLGFRQALAMEFHSRTERIRRRLDGVQWHDDETEENVEDAEWSIQFEMLPARDDLEWALHAVRFFKLEFATWKILSDFDDEHAARELASLDEEMRQVIKMSKDDRWIAPDRNAPKSFWWRHLKPHSSKEDTSHRREQKK